MVLCIAMKWLLDIIYPRTITEDTVHKLHGLFPLHISTHYIKSHTKSKDVKVTALSDYADKRVSALIQSLKYTKNSNSIQILSKVLGDYLLDEIASYRATYPGGTLLIIPIPLSKKRLRERGFNQVELLIKHAVRQCPDIANFVDMKTLIKYKHTKPQTHLNRQERLENVKDVFTTKTSKEGADIILVDDVCTTGATALEATKVLIKAGAKSVSILTIARTL